MLVLGIRSFPTSCGFLMSFLLFLVFWISSTCSPGSEFYLFVHWVWRPTPLFSAFEIRLFIVRVPSFIILFMGVCVPSPISCDFRYFYFVLWVSSPTNTTVGCEVYTLFLCSEFYGIIFRVLISIPILRGFVIHFLVFWVQSSIPGLLGIQVPFPCSLDIRFHLSCLCLLILITLFPW